MTPEGRNNLLELTRGSFKDGPVAAGVERLAVLKRRFMKH